ncbi:periplasmic serine protease [Sulfurimonas gotlandica GD1]|uniref:Periplasmic serine protease n=1 Tax=Sulfurimonas gotlandica (strain DSM 19862 / JCM 16533 / GD1) TaxID=929558 RepID=B6BJX8_SULGG|nr:S1C family serine protease [Sulfurimonas gotlandica]EDZ62767.1 Trypsin domain protein [Sulfurimonas gotlandica GD1]EHP31381.1 periplasmic serine protease [Sulfurimonas gotlandica GD1]
MKKLLYILLTTLLSTNILANTEVEESIVKIYTVSKTPNYMTPWNSNINRSHGSGSIIEGNRILTNAHIVANETFIEVKRYGSSKRYEAKVEYISHQADLAVLRVKDETFFKGAKSLTFGELPTIRQEVTVYGFPMGGDSLSASTGIVSRIEHNRYAHSKEIFLSIQIDAAVNPGSSGGPAVSNGKIVGVVMQQISRSQNLGYLVPAEIIKHFLDDIKDKKYDGFAHMGIGTQKMENETLRRVNKMDDNTTGVLIIDVAQKSAAFDKIKPGDVLLSIDCNKIENDGTVEFRHHQFTSYKYYIDKKQLGESVTVRVLRDGKKQKISVQLNNIADDNLLVDTVFYDVMPKYYVYGGYVFSPLSRNLLMNSNSTLLELRDAASKWATDDKEEVVLLLKVLASDISRGDHNFSLWIVDKVNSKKFKNFKEFLKIVKEFDGKYLIIENEEGVKIAIDREKALEIEKTILKRYSIKSSERL